MNQLNENIQKLKLGDEEAFAYLYAQFESPLVNHLYKMLGRVEKAEEVFQEVMMTMIKKINFYEHRAELQNSFKAWIFRIATNHAIDELRRSKRKRIEFKEEFTADIAEDVIENDLSEKLGDLIMSLPVIQRTFLNLKVKEDLSHLEIATICGCNVNAVKQGLFRARKSLKDLILEEGLGI
jgi:RNA polymerase sigma-70 factor (ECF subfamily)